MENLQLWRDDPPTKYQIATLARLQQEVGQIVSVERKGGYADEILRLKAILANRRFKARMDKYKL